MFPCFFFVCGMSCFFLRCFFSKGFNIIFVNWLWLDSSDLGGNCKLDSLTPTPPKP